MDYEGMLEDLRAMRKRTKQYQISEWSLWTLEADFLMSITEFIQEINELIASEASYERG